MQSVWIILRGNATIFGRKWNQIGQFCNQINAETRRAIALTDLFLDASEFKLHTFEAWQSTLYESGQWNLTSFQTVLFEKTANWSGLLYFRPHSWCSPCTHLPPRVQTCTSLNSGARSLWRRLALATVAQFFNAMFLMILWPFSSICYVIKTTSLG